MEGPCIIFRSLFLEFWTINFRRVERRLKMALFSAYVIPTNLLGLDVSVHVIKWRVNSSCTII